MPSSAFFAHFSIKTNAALVSKTCEGIKISNSYTEIFLPFVGTVLYNKYQQKPINRTVSNNRSFWGFWLRNINRIFWAWEPSIKGSKRIRLLGFCWYPTAVPPRMLSFLDFEENVTKDSSVPAVYSSLRSMLRPLQTHVTDPQVWGWCNRPQ